MARSNMKPRGRISLPRNWRVITAASLTTLGLVYQTGQPVLGDWRSLTKGKPESTKASATKPGTAKPTGSENGFSSTIQRLMSDARLYADKGDLDKAVQLADRAAKISEASAQLLGPASDCSPETTARFAEDLRSRRDAMARSTSPATNVGRSPTRGVVVTPPTTEPGKKITVERAIAERPATERQQPLGLKPALEQPAELNSEARVGDLASREELPPTPAPEAEPTSKPIKFRRSIISRATLDTEPDADFVDSRSVAEEETLPSIAEVTSDEMPDVPTTNVADSEAADPFADETFREPSGQVADSQPMLDDPYSPPSVEIETSLNDTSPATTAETPSVETTPTEVTTAEAAPAKANDDEFVEPFAVPSAAPTTRPPAWEDEGLADVPIPQTTATAPIAIIPIETETPTTPVTSARPVFEDDFPVDRVVKLRRRLETATSLNPGAYTMPGTSAAGLKPTSGATQTVTPSPTAAQPAVPETEPTAAPAKESEFELPTSASLAPAAAPATVPRKVKLRRAFAPEPRQPASEVVASTEQSTPPASSSTTFDAASASQSNAVSRTSPTERTVAAERPALRLREHRRLSGPVRTAMLEAAATPSSPASRKHVVGHSEPILWQSADNRHTGLPTLSIANGTSGSGSSEGKVLPPDLRQVVALSETVSESRTTSRKPSSASVERSAFQDITLPADSNPATEPNKTSSRSKSVHASESSEGLKRRPKPTSDSPDSPAKTSTAKFISDDVSRQSFAMIEPLANALQLPLATTASLLGGASLALVGLGLILIRVAIRWRYS